MNLFNRIWKLIQSNSIYLYRSHSTVIVQLQPNYLLICIYAHPFKYVDDLRLVQSEREPWLSTRFSVPAPSPALWRYRAPCLPVRRRQCSCQWVKELERVKYPQGADLACQWPRLWCFCRCLSLGRYCELWTRID